MSYLDTYISVIKNNYTNFDGRARRAEYWQYTLINYLIIYGFQVLGIVTEISAIALIGSVISLATFLPSIAVIIRRMHDVNKSGWFCLIPFYNLYLAVTEGTNGVNEYGPDPKGENLDIEEFGKKEVFEN